MCMLLLLLALPIFIAFLLSMHNKSRRKYRRPPGPRGLPIIGNIHQFDVSKLHVCLSKLSNKYGPLMFLRLCQMPVIVISSAEVAKKALKDNDLAFAGKPFSTATSRLSYGNNDIIFSSNTEYWKEMRKMVVHHLFSPQKVRSFRPILEEEVSRLIDEISKKSNSDQFLNIGEIATSFSFNLLCRIACGKRLDEGLGSSKRRFDKIMGALTASVMDTFFADYLPLFGLICKLSGAAPHTLEKGLDDMDSIYQQVIDEHLSPNRPDSMKNDILDLLIQLKEDHSAPVKIDWNHIKALLMNVLVAGSDTSAVTIIWALTALMKKPSAMKKVQHEIRNLVGKKRSVDEDDIEKLPYLKAVIKETMRLYPPIPLLIRQTIERCVIDGYEIQPKSFVLVNIWAIGRDLKYWENPNEFMPDRFLNTTTIDFKGQDFQLLPFGSGRRICPGLNLGVAIVEMALANLLHSFNWEVPYGMREEDIDTNASTGLALHKKTPLCLMAKSYF